MLQFSPSIASPSRAPARVARRLALAAATTAALASVAGPAHALSWMGEPVTITFAGTARQPTSLPGFGTISAHTVNAGVELSEDSHSSYAAYFGNGSILFDLNHSTSTGKNLLSIVYSSGAAGAGASVVDDMAFTVQLANPLRAFGGTPTESFDFFSSRTAGGQGWVATQLNPNTITFNLQNLAAPTGSGFTTGAEFSFDVNALAPVPEPQTQALLLAGLGLLGWMTARRRSQPR